MGQSARFALWESPHSEALQQFRVFDTFPFPADLLPNIPSKQFATNPTAVKIAEAAANFNSLRENWLNPTDLVSREPEVVEGLP